MNFISWKNNVPYRFPDYGKAIEAAENIFELLNRKPAINNESKDGDEIVRAHCKHFTLINDIVFI